MPSFAQNRLKQMRKIQISASVKHAINKIYGFDFLAVPTSILMEQMSVYSSIRVRITSLE